MKIAHITSDLSFAGAGLAKAVIDLALAQSRLGSLNVKIFGGLGSRGYGSPKEISSKSFIKYETLGPSQLGYFPKIGSDLNDFNPDIIHVHGLWSMSVWHGYRGSRNLKCPLIVSPHGMLSDYSLNRSSVKKKLFSILFQNKCLKFASVLHATSLQELEEIGNFIEAKRIFVIPNGIDDMSNQIVNKPMLRSKTLLYLGRIHEKKGLDLLLKAWVNLSKTHRDWSLKIVGMDEANELARLKKLSMDLKLDRVQFEGPVFSERKIETYARADLFVLPTKNENFGLVVAESLISGVPVVCSKNAPWEGLEINKCGRWIDLEIDIFISTLSSLMSLPSSELVEMGQRGRLWMLKEYSWESIATRFVCLYKELLN